MTDTELRKEYEKQFGHLRSAVNVFDPYGLISEGAPSDEYDTLANKVLGLHHRGESRNKIRETILSQVADYFGEDAGSLEGSHKTVFNESLEKFLDETQGLK